MLPATLLIPVGETYRQVSVRMASADEIVRAARWRMPKILRDLDQPNSGANGEQKDAVSKAKDSLEFSRLSAKRWKHYRDTGTAAATLADLRALIEASPRGEFCFFLNLTAPWFPGNILGQVMLRRTWCHHLFMEFLYAHPTISGRIAEVKKGVGFALLISVASVARNLEIPIIWGEATEVSASWYEAQFKRRVRDHFSIDKKLIRNFARKFDEGRKLAAEIPDDV